MRPTFRDRLTASGDLIPASRTAGEGGIPAHKVFTYENASTGTGGSYPAGTRMMGYQHDFTSADYNRAFWYLANCADYLHEKELVMPMENMYGSGGAPNTERIMTLYPVYLGETGYAVADLPKVISVWDSGRNELIESGTQVVVSDIYTQTGGGGGAGVSCYPVGGLPAVNTVPALVAPATSGTNLVLQGAGLAAAITGVSLFNYSGYMRGVRDNIGVANLGKFFVTIEAGVNPNFTVHRDVTVLGWLADDEIYISHYACYIYANFNVPISAMTTYFIPYGTYRILGNTEEGPPLRFSNIPGHPLQYELLMMRDGGLDGAYDRVTLGPAGSGRQVTVDAGPIETLAPPPSGAHLRATSSALSTIGTLAYEHRDIYPSAINTIALSTGVLKLMRFNDESIISNAGEVCTGLDAGTYRIVLDPAGGRFSNGAGGLTNLIPGLDLAWIEDGSGDPLADGGWFKYMGVDPADEKKADFRYFAGTAVSFLTLGAAKIYIYRPILMSPWRQDIGGTEYTGNVLTAFNPHGNSSAQMLFSTINGPNIGHFQHMILGDLNEDVPVYDKHPRVCTLGGGVEWGTEEGWGLVSAGAGLDNEVFTRYLERAANSRYMFFQEELCTPKPYTYWLFNGAPAGKVGYITRGITPRGLGVGAKDGAGLGNHTQISYEFGDYPAAGSGRVVFDELVANEPYYGLQMSKWGGGSLDALLKEAPSAVPPGGGATDRFELTSTANFGHSAVRPFTKVAHVSLGHAISGWVWTMAVSPHTYWEHPGSAAEIVIIPLPDLPLDVVITGYSVYFYNAGDISGSPAVAQLQGRLFAATDYVDIVATDRNIGPIAAVWDIYPKAGLTVTHDSENYCYALRVTSSNVAQAQRVGGVQVTFAWVDVLP